MKKSLWILTAMLVAASLTVATAGAKPKMDKEQACCPMRGKLNLTEDQQKQIEKLKLDLDKAVLPLETQIEVKEAELKGLLIVDNPNVEAVYAKIDEIGGLRTQIQKKRVAHELDVRKLLTPEQRLQFDKRVMKGFDRMEMRRKGGPGMRNRIRMFMQRHRGGPVIEKEEKIEIKKEE